MGLQFSELEKNWIHRRKNLQNVIAVWRAIFAIYCLKQVQTRRWDVSKRIRKLALKLHRRNGKHWSGLLIKNFFDECERCCPNYVTLTSDDMMGPVFFCVVSFSKMKVLGNSFEYSRRFWWCKYRRKPSGLWRYNFDVNNLVIEFGQSVSKREWRLFTTLNEDQKKCSICITIDDQGERDPSGSGEL